MEAVFKALADDSRREVLDLLYEREGRTLGELSEHFEMTRFGVMKHLRVLEEAGLVTSTKAGREKLHYLNPVPIRQIHDRWIGKFSARATATLIDLKKSLEEDEMDLMDKPTHVFEIFIQTTPEHLWEALTESDFTTQYYYASKIESDFKPGSDYRMTLPDGTEAIRGEVVEARARQAPRDHVRRPLGRWRRGRRAVPHQLGHRAAGRLLQAQGDPRRLRGRDRDLPPDRRRHALHPERPQDAARDGQAARGGALRVNR